MLLYTQSVRISAGVVLLLIACSLLPAQSSSKRSAAAAKKAAVPEPPPPSPPPTALEKKPEVPATERLTYEIEWRLIHAGTAIIETQKSAATLKLDSAGMVSTLFKVHDLYAVNYDDGFCASSASMDSQEGKRHHDTKITYDRVENRAAYLERDLIKNTVLHSDTVQIPACVHEVIGAFLKLRAMNPVPGQTVQIPMSDGRRYAAVKIEAQEREDVKTTLGAFKTVRVEANMMNGVVYTRKGRVFVWLTDDERHLPVQIRLRMSFPVGSVTLQLEKEERF
jgi:hypothetical protein